MSKQSVSGASSSVAERGRVIELFAGVGGFRIGLEGVPQAFRSQLHSAAGYDPDGGQWSVVWANQWEPGASAASQHAWDCYARNFGMSDAERIYGNRDIGQVPVDEVPDHDLLVGGFPCQDYSVAKPLNQAHGLQGKKGVLWWEIHRIVEGKSPDYLLLENVDRLLKSPATQRGRDFAIILATLSDLDYAVEWRVINAAEYGFPQRRRRVFIVGRHRRTLPAAPPCGFTVINTEGILARALPSKPANGVGPRDSDFTLEGEAHELSAKFGIGRSASQFENAGFMVDRQVWTQKTLPDPSPNQKAWAIQDIVVPQSVVPETFLIPESQLGETGVRGTTWRYLKGAKSEPRTHAGSDTEYRYSEGGMTFPDDLKLPARTILTGEGGKGPSRFKHAIQQDGVYRRLVPVELERLNGFPDDWTVGMPDTRRAFCMGNALVIGVVRAIGDELAENRRSRLG